MAGAERLFNSRCVLARENRGTFVAVDVAKVRITMQAAGATVIRGVMAPAKGARLHPAMSTTSLSKLQKQTLANGLLPRSARTLSAKPDIRTSVEP